MDSRNLLFPHFGESPMFLIQKQRFLLHARVLTPAWVDGAPLHQINLIVPPEYLVNATSLRGRNEAYATVLHHIDPAILYDMLRSERDQN